MRTAGRLSALLAAVLAALTLGSAMPEVGDDPLTPDARAWIDERGALRVGYIHLPPVAYVTEGEVTGGWGVELIELAALKVGIDVEPVVFDDLASMVAGLASGEVDAIGLAAARPDLTNVAEPTEPFGWTPTVVVVGSSRPDASAIADLDGSTVTTIAGSVLEVQLTELFPELTYVPTASVPEGVAAVSAGDIDAFYGPLAVIGANVQAQGGRALRPVGEAVSVAEVGAWAAPDSPALEILTTARELVTLDEMRVIHVRWTGFDLTERSDVGISPWVWRGLLIALGMVLVLAAVAWTLRRRVAAATAELRAYQEDLEALVDERTAQLQRSNDALSGFAGAVAHDLRGPLASAAGLAESLRLGILTDDDRAVVLERIEVASRRAAELVADMLRAAAADGPARPSSRTAADLETWARDLLGPQVDRTGATLRFDIDGATVDAPDGAVMPILVNLVDNALKYAGTRPHISVGVRRVGDLLVLDVDDDGPGVPEAERDRIFARGVQGDDDSPGYGHGLARCREIAVAHGGDLIYTVAPSGGARFRATLRAADASEDLQPA